MSVNNICTLKIYSQSAEQGTALSSLTNLGVNTSKFSKEFNEFTKSLPEYILLYIIVFIESNRKYSFKIKRPSTGFLLNLFKFEQVYRIKISDRFHQITFNSIKLVNILYIALFKFPKLTIKQSFFIVLGTIKSMKLKIIY